MAIPSQDTLSAGFYGVPAGHVATIVTTLEMRAPPPRLGTRSLPDGWQIRAVEKPGLDWYRGLFRRVGAPWLWFSRLRLPDEALAAVIHDDRVATWSVHGTNDGTPPQDEGLLELDFRVPGACELAFFGLSAALIGKGIGRNLMTHAITEAWSRPIERLWVHTCTLDHPAALEFYVRSGFAPILRQVEIAPDPRLDGTVPETDAPQIPILR